MRIGFMTTLLSPGRHTFKFGGVLSAISSERPLRPIIWEHLSSIGGNLHDEQTQGVWSVQD
jgi:hypothetical protein